MAKIASQMRFDETLYEKTKIIAESELRSINAQIEYFMKKGIESYESENGVILLPKED
ncbi:MAG: hypothetical protein IJO79_00685 [Firmicutes bacterium]|nr:hypothetical protein [Bacillota bacterium]